MAYGDDDNDNGYCISVFQDTQGKVREILFTAYFYVFLSHNSVILLMLRHSFVLP